MNIRTKLTLRFILITAIIFLLASVLIYYLSAEYRQEDFYTRLHNNANNTAKLLIDVDEVDSELLRRIERDNPVRLPSERIIVYNYRDTVLFSTDEDNIINVDTALLDRIRIQDELRYEQGEYEVLGFLFKGRYDRFVVIAAATDIYGFKRLKNLIFILLLVFVISIVVVSFSGWFYAGRALRPIARVVRQVDEISIANLDIRLDEGNGQDEIAMLSKTFNSMLSRLETSFKAQKNFISNASHELRTPLTAVTGQLEVTLLNPRSSEEYKTVIQSVLEDIIYLNRLSNRLLMLAQTTAEDRRNGMGAVRIDEVIWQAKEEVRRHHTDFKVNIDLEEDLDDTRLTINGDEQLLRTAFANIMENGCKYSSDKTTNVFIHKSIDSLTVRFKDEGLGIAPEDIANIFEPFYRGSNTLNIKGHGIGLSMVKAIVKLHHGTIQLTSQVNHGTRFIIQLPLASKTKRW